MKSWPTLYRKLETGKIKRWDIYVLETALITIQHGFVDGKIQTIEERIFKGKNIGKANETTPYEQACLEAESKWKRQIDAGYVEDESGETDIMLPMLAQDFKKNKHRVRYPADAQPKLNGVRCLAKKVSATKIEFISRKNKRYTTLKHIEKELLPIMKIGDVLDGEIYIHEATFQEIIRLVKKYRKGETEKLEYWCYDMAIPKLSFTDRSLNLVNLLITGVTGYAEENLLVRFVQTETVDSEKELKMWHDDWVKEGFEGAILRDIHDTYHFNGRVVGLLKYKEFFDKEVTIIGGVSGKGLEEGCVIFKVRDEFGNEFSSRPKGTRETRRRWLRDIKLLIGKELTIRYQELSEDNVPVFNVGIAIRDYE